MNWYKKANALYDPQRAHQMDSKAIKLLNFIKSTNITVPLYHGTTLPSWQKSQQMGYLVSVSYLNQSTGFQSRITPKDDSGYVFLEAGKNMAHGYGKRYVRQMATNLIDGLPSPLPPCPPEIGGVVLTINMPLYAINEVRNAISAGHEVATGVRLQNLNWDEPQAAVQSIVQQITGDRLGGWQTYSSYMAIPVKWVKQVEPLQDVAKEVKRQYTNRKRREARRNSAPIDVAPLL